MEDYAKRNTKEKFNWGEAVISALILPSILMFSLLLETILKALK